MFECGDKNIAKLLEIRKKISNAHKGKKLSEEHKRKIGKASKGKTYEQLYGKERARIEKEKRWLGKKNSEHSKRMSGSNHPLYGKHFSNKSRNLMSKTRKQGIEDGRIIIWQKGLTHIIDKRILGGENASNWRGGKSFEPYTPEFNEALKKQIRKRDKYICQLCGEKNSKTVHHKDYIKINCKENNLITLCNSCNSKVNYNRQWWIDYFLEI